jgi:hypothetical protein
MCFPGVDDEGLPSCRKLSGIAGPSLRICVPSGCAVLSCFSERHKWDPLQGSLTQSSTKHQHGWLMDRSERPFRQGLGRVGHCLVRLLRRKVFGISPNEIRPQKRGFRPGTPDANLKLEKIGRFFVTGYNAALEEDSVSRLGLRLRQIEPEFTGFAFEGAAMALVLLDHLHPFRRDRWTALVRGAGQPYVYMMHVGAGWALARLRWVHWNLESFLARLDPLLRWLAIDGCGFHDGYFHWPRCVLRQEIPVWLGGYALRAFDQGLGRSLWFVEGCNVNRIATAIAAFPGARRADFWSGVGLACAYAGGATEDEISRLWDLAGCHRGAFAQGVAFAAKARQQAGNFMPHTEIACRISWRLNGFHAAAITDQAQQNLDTEGLEPAYEVWRRRVQNGITARPEVNR